MCCLQAGLPSQLSAVSYNLMTTPRVTTLTVSNDHPDLASRRHQNGSAGRVCGENRHCQLSSRGEGSREVKSRNPVTPSRSPHFHRVYQQMTAGRVGNARDLIADIRRSGDATVRFVYNGGQGQLLDLSTVF